MKIVFAGTPEFSAHALSAIVAAGHEIVLVLTQPDRRAGRGMHLKASPTKVEALKRKIPVLQPLTLKRNHVDVKKSTEAQETYQHLAGLEFDAMVVVAYGLILPQEILDLASQNHRHGCFNIHASLLPRWRGAAPIQRAIESGDVKTGISIMQMDAGLDTGDVVLVGELTISPQETSASLHDRLADMGSDLMVRVLSSIEQGAPLLRAAQALEGVTYANKILKNEAAINWQLSAIEIERRIRAFNPFPGATSSLNHELLKFWSACLPNKIAATQTKNPGEVLEIDDGSVFVQCGDGVIEVLEMQKPGGKRISASACLSPYRSQEKIMQFQKDSVD